MRRDRYGCKKRIKKAEKGKRGVESKKVRMTIDERSREEEIIEGRDKRAESKTVN